MLFEWSWLGSLLAALYFLRSLAIEFVPPGMVSYLHKAIRLSWTREMSIMIEEFDYHGYSENFDAALRYLSHKFSSSASFVKLTDSATSLGYSFTIDTNQYLDDELDGIKVRWSFCLKDSAAIGRGGTTRVRFLGLAFHRALNDSVREQYFPAILAISRELEARQRARKLYTNSSWGERGSLWSSVPFSHTSTFDTLALDPELKSSLMGDLAAFRSKKDYYERVGKAWKRGYLLYGPPGTGKTSLVAAMANFMEYDVYDLELTAVASNSQLRRLLVETNRRSLIVIEDIDRSIPLSDVKLRRWRPLEEEEEDTGVDEEGWGGAGGGGGDHQLSLSGVLNFMDGLWSCCGEERIIVVTTNNKERLDPALLRPGRLDMHVNLSYCGVEALRKLASNYLYSDGVDKNDGRRLVEEYWTEVEELLPKVQVTPATVAEVFLRSERPEMARSKLAAMLKKKLSAGGGGGLQAEGDK